MAIFLITPLADNFEAVKKALSDGQLDWIPLQANAGFLASYRGTTVELSHLIGITNPEKNQPSAIGPAMVTTVTSYYGRGPADMWEWLKVRFES